LIQSGNSTHEPLPTHPLPCHRRRHHPLPRHCRRPTLRVPWPATRRGPECHANRPATGGRWTGCFRSAKHWSSASRRSGRAEGNSTQEPLEPPTHPLPCHRRHHPLPRHCRRTTLCIPWLTRRGPECHANGPATGGRWTGCFRSAENWGNASSCLSRRLIQSGNSTHESLKPPTHPLPCHRRRHHPLPRHCRRPTLCIPWPPTRRGPDCHAK